MADDKTTDTADTKKTAASTEPVFAKAQLIEAKKYSARVDLLNALLEDNTSYTFSEVDALIDGYYKKEVN